MTTFSEEQVNAVLSADLKKYIALHKIIELARNHTFHNSNISLILNKAEEALKD